MGFLGVRGNPCNSNVDLRLKVSRARLAAVRPQSQTAVTREKRRSGSGQGGFGRCAVNFVSQLLGKNFIHPLAGMNLVIERLVLRRIGAPHGVEDARHRAKQTDRRGFEQYRELASRVRLRSAPSVVCDPLIPELPPATSESPKASRFAVAAEAFVAANVNAVAAVIGVVFIAYTSPLPLADGVWHGCRKRTHEKSLQFVLCLF